MLTILLAIAVAGGALWLGVQTAGSVAGCETGGACSEVLSSRWSSFYGVPVAFAGAALWLVLGLTAVPFVRGSRSAAGWAGMFAVTGTLLGAAWFTGLQVFVVKSLCVWCLILNALAATAAGMLLWNRRLNARDDGLSLTAGWLAGAIALSLLAASAGENRPTATAGAAPSATRRLLPVQGGAAADLAGLPVTGHGAPAAVMLMDFTCTHCRKMLAVLREMAARDASMPSVALLPACLSEESRRIHRTLLTLHRANAEAWEQVVAALLDGKLPARSDAVAHAALIAAGPGEFGAALQQDQEIIAQQLRQAEDIYAANRSAPGGSRALPQLLNRERLLTGMETSAARLAEFLGTSPLPAAAPATPVIAAADLPEMSPARSAAELPQWRPRPLTPAQQSPRPPAALVNSSNP